MNEEILNTISETLDEAVDIFLSSNDISKEELSNFKKYVAKNTISALSQFQAREKLELLFNYEKNYLMLIKEFKEEIKFASAMQEDLRKERSKFFAEILDDVYSTLNKAQIKPEITDQWVHELVSSYTKSLDVSSDLLNDGTLSSYGKLVSESVSEKELIKNNNE
jgi:hypothetical protein